MAINVILRLVWRKGVLELDAVGRKAFIDEGNTSLDYLSRYMDRVAN